MAISTDIDQAVQLLNTGHVIAIPTETVYGLSANIYNEKAIKEIFELKQRPLFNPLIVHIHSIDQMNELVINVPEKAKALMDNFWPGPLTFILDKKDTVSDLITSGKDTVAIRMPNHPMTLKLLSKLEFPIAAPSANPFGSISPTNAAHVDDYFKENLSMVLDGGDCQNGIESTIIGFEDDQAVIYRLGSISNEDIAKVIGDVQVKNHDNKAPKAPGMIDKHYAPNTKTIMVTDIGSEIVKHPDQRIGLLTFRDSTKYTEIIITKTLSAKGSLEEAAHSLYSCLHELDKCALDLIIVEKMPDEGLGRSINDRLLRATKS